MKFNRDKIISELNLHSFGAKGWLSNKNLNCPQCGKSGKFGIFINESGRSTVHCFIDGFSQSLFQYLKDIGRSDLIDKNEDVRIEEKLSESIDPEVEEIDYTMEEKRLPLGYKRVFDDKYLNLRGFTSEQYNLFEIGRSSVDPRVKDVYVIFPLKEECGKNVGWIARSELSKKWHEENLKNAKNGKCDLVLRYDNSVYTDFSKYIYGMNEVTENTVTMILVEGIFSKFAVDRKLDLYSGEEMKCGATFGQNVSDFQIKRLLDKGIKNIVLLYDNNTFLTTKKYSQKLLDYFNVKIGYIRSENKDPDDVSQDELLYVMENLEDPVYFAVNRLDGLKLKI